LNGNNLVGTIPNSIGDLTMATNIDFSANTLSGIIPASMGKITELVNLTLYGNSFSGTLPPELGNLLKLKVVSLDDSADLHWTIPLEWGSLTLTTLYLSGSGLCIPTSMAGALWWDNIGAKDGSPPPTCDPIFADGFESGDMSAWSAIKGASSHDSLAIADAYATEYGIEAVDKLIVNKAASLIDQKGLKVRVVNKAVHYLQDTSPAAETSYHARFYIDINGLTMGKNHQFELFQGRKGTKKVFYLTVKKNGGKYWIRGSVRLDNGTYKNTLWTVLPKTTKAVEIDWKAGVGNGFLKLYVNDVLKVKKLNVDNDTLSVKAVRLGITKKIKPAHTVSGAFYLDQYGSDSSTHIGK
ncbi:MAG: hypothetical protein N2D54_12590, partial [Chloroflexota bacterium]